MAGLDLKIPLTKMGDGQPIPMLGYGTGTAWFKNDSHSSLDQNLISSTTTAAKLGYTHLDGAEVYKTEPELGAAIQASAIPRNQLFITTKVYPHISDIPAALAASLKKLGLDYVDLYLIHAPFFAESEGDLQAKWAEMEGVKKSGKAKSIGVSNYTKRHLDATLKTAVERPALNQIEYHPYLQHKHVEGDLIAYHREKGIAVAAYGCLTPIIRAKDAGPLTTSDAALLEGLATKYAVNPSEILIRWCLDQDIVVITTTAKEQRMSDYLRALAFRLTPREVKEIAEVGERFHYRAFWNDKFVEGDRV